MTLDSGWTYDTVSWAGTGLRVLVACRGARVCRVQFLRESHAPRREGRHSPASTRFATEPIAAYLAGERRPLQLPVDWNGTPFQERVWSALQSIPFGTVTTYGAVARTIGSPGASRAVGGAVGKNPIAILVPCHRVVASTGLGGFTGGVDIKKLLLHLEQVQLPYSLE